MVRRLILRFTPGQSISRINRRDPSFLEILYADDLFHVFQRLGGFPRVATSTQESYETTVPAGGTRTRFYRLRLVP